MFTSIMLGLASAIAGAGVPADGDLPIAGVWRALPSPGALGPDRLRISTRQIRFGEDGEAVHGWKATNATVRITTRTGLTYVFRREGQNRICLMSSLRAAAQTEALSPSPLRCFVRETSAQAVM